MQSTSHAFKSNARRALEDATLQTALGMAKTGFLAARAARDRAAAGIRGAARRGPRASRTTRSTHLDFYLETFEQKVTERGGQVHWAAPRPRRARPCSTSAAAARRQDRHQGQVDDRRGDRAQRSSSRRTGSTPIETDLGEYIIQLRHEPPSHIIAPAIHLMKEQVAETFRAAHTDARSGARARPSRRQLCDEARQMLRPKFLAADVGITGANFLIAETGSRSSSPTRAMAI